MEIDENAPVWVPAEMYIAATPSSARRSIASMAQTMEEAEAAPDSAAA